MESQGANAMFMMPPGPCNPRRNSLYGRSSVSPSLMYARSSPQPSFRNAPFNVYEKLQSYNGGPTSRNFPQFRAQNSYASNKVPRNQYTSQPNRSFPKRRTQSESVSMPPVETTRRNLQAEFNVVPSKPCNSICKNTVSKSKSTPSKLPSAVTCAELEAAVAKTRPKLLTCAELEALQAKEKNAALLVDEVEKKKTETSVTLLTEDNKLKSLDKSTEEMKPKLPVPLLKKEKSSESCVTILAEEMKTGVENTLKDKFTDFWTLNPLSAEPDSCQTSVSSWPSISSEISILEELSSRSNSPYNLCSSPVSSTSSGYESCSSESCDSSSKFTVVDDSGLDKSFEETDSIFYEKKSAKKSLLNDFIASKTSDFQLQPQFAPSVVASEDDTETIEESCFRSPLVVESRAKFVAGANQSSSKQNSKKRPEEKSLLDHSSPADLEMYKTHHHGKNVSASGSSTRKSRNVVIAGRSSHKTVMPLTNSPPGALQLPSPPKAWKSQVPAFEEHEVPTRSVDITQEIKQLVGVSSVSSVE
ncbi:hypothetical protein FHG87_004914 [Trinorchestia longiramus]|nr:hypothetical protein FHG87_004914 [Trinorchestia longiramus]